MNILEGENFSVTYDSTEAAFKMNGILRLRGMEEYQPISDFLANIVGETDAINIDLSELEYLNSSGIAVLSKFVIAARKANAKVRMIGSGTVAWQGKSLNNLKRLMPALDLVFH